MKLSLRVESLVDLRTGLVYGIDEDGEWYFNGSGKRPEELQKEEEKAAPLPCRHGARRACAAR